MIKVSLNRLAQDFAETYPRVVGHMNFDQFDEAEELCNRFLAWTDKALNQLFDDERVSSKEFDRISNLVDFTRLHLFQLLPREAA
jgi:hypothetical protein